MASPPYTATEKYDAASPRRDDGREVLRRGRGADEHGRLADAGEQTHADEHGEARGEHVAEHRDAGDRGATQHEDLPALRVAEDDRRPAAAARRRSANAPTASPTAVPPPPSESSTNRGSTGATTPMAMK